MVFSIDTEYAHGISGTIDISRWDGRGGRIGPDMIVEGDLDDLISEIMTGSVKKFIDINEYAPIQCIIVSDEFTSFEIEQLKSTGLEVEEG